MTPTVQLGVLPCALLIALATVASAPAETKTRYVKTMIVPAADPTQTRRFFGRIAARETVDLSFEVGGRLESLNATEGVRIREGARLATLDLAPFRRGVERAELALVQAERDLERARRLAETSAGSEVRAQDAETARDLASVALREARDALSDAKIDAPFDGLIARRIAAEHSTVDPGQPILRVHDMSEVRVEFDLPERLLSQLGDPATARYAGYLPGSEASIPLRFAEFQAEVDGLGQSYVVSLSAPKDGIGSLTPGASVTVEATVSHGVSGVALPPDALVADAERRIWVFALASDAEPTTLRKTPVQVVSNSGRGVIVEGIAPGAEIVAAGAHLLSDGVAVKRWRGLIVEE